MTYKIALATDLHFGVKKGSDLFLNSQMKFFRELFIPYIKQNKIKEVCFLGDTFDNRNHVSIKVMKAVMDLFDEISEVARITVLVGNHDMFYTNRNDVHSLEMFKKHENVRVIDSNQVVDFNKRKAYIVPWVVDEEKFVTDALSVDDDVKICMGHFEFSGFKMFSDKVCEHGLPASHFFDKFDLTLSGHFHVRSENEKAGKKIVYIGNPYHLTRNDIGDERGFAVLDMDSCSLEYINNDKSIQFKRIKYPEKAEKSEIQGNIIDVYVDYDDSYDEAKFQAYIKELQELEPAQPPTVKISNVGLSKVEGEIDTENLSTEELIKEYLQTQEVPHVDKVYSTLIEIMNDCKRE